MSQLKKQLKLKSRLKYKYLSVVILINNVTNITKQYISL